MEVYFLFTTATIVGIFAFTLFIYYLLFTQKNGQERKAPEVAGAWPLLGHLHLLGGPELPHKTLGSLADKYGPIFTIKLGLHRALVLSDSKVAKEFFTMNDVVFANRPKSLGAELLGYNYAMVGLTPYGPYWRQVRKIVTLELLSNRRLQMLGHVRVSEVKTSTKDIYTCWLKNKNSSNRVKMEMKEWFGTLLLNFVVRIIVGKKYLPDDGEEVRSQKVVMRKLFELLGEFVVSDFVPFLRCLDLGGYAKKMKKTAKELDYIVNGWLKDHKRKRKSNPKSCEDEDFMDVMLSILETARKEEFSGFDNDTVIKATCMVHIV